MGSRLPWRDLICILEMIALNSTSGVATKRERKARSGPGVQGLREMKIERFEDIETAKET